MMVISLELTEHQRNLISIAVFETAHQYKQGEKATEMRRLQVIIDQLKSHAIEERNARVQE